MFKEIKKMLIEQTDVICDLLEYYGFEHINYKTREIRFARDIDGGQNISIRLDNNENVLVKDYAKNECSDLFAYICKEKHEKLKDVLLKTKSLLKLEKDWAPKKRVELFGGIYNDIRKNNGEEKLKEIDESELDKYDFCPNIRFLRDGISIDTQNDFGIRYDTLSERIVIPIRDEIGRLVGAKGRYNAEPDEAHPKYIYIIPVSSSQLLFGYSENYQYLYGHDVVICESEKAVMQAYSFGFRNVVGLGSNSLSDKQAELVLQLQPERVIFALDEGLDLSSTKRNASKIKEHSGFNSFKILYWNYKLDSTIPHKASPTDLGKDKFFEILNNQLEEISDKI